MKFETIMKMNLMSTFLWNARLRTLTSRYQRFETIFCFQVQKIKNLSAKICYLPNQLNGTALEDFHRLKDIGCLGLWDKRGGNKTQYEVRMEVKRLGR